MIRIFFQCHLRPPGLQTAVFGRGRSPCPTEDPRLVPEFPGPDSGVVPENFTPGIDKLLRVAGRPPQAKPRGKIGAAKMGIQRVANNRQDPDAPGLGLLEKLVLRGEVEREGPACWRPFGSRWRLKMAPLDLHPDGLEERQIVAGFHPRRIGGKKRIRPQSRVGRRDDPDFDCLRRAARRPRRDGIRSRLCRQKHFGPHLPPTLRRLHPRVPVHRPSKNIFGGQGHLLRPGGAGERDEDPHRRGGSRPGTDDHPVNSLRHAQGDPGRLPGRGGQTERRAEDP